MNGSRKLISLVFFFLFAAALSSASDIYIAQDSAGANTGVDCADAHSATWFNSSSNWGSATGQIGPGTTVHVCGTVTGVTGGSVLVFQGSGSSGNPITLTFEEGASLSAPYCNSLGNSSGCLVISTPNNPHSNIVVDGGTPCGWTNAGGSEGSCNGMIVNTNSGTKFTTNTSTNGIEMEECSNCEVRNIGIYNIYLQSGGDTNANPQYENAIFFSGSNIKIHNNQFHDCGWCMFYQNRSNDTNLQVYQNDVYNTAHPIFWSGGTGTASNGFIYANHFHDYSNWNTTGCVYHVEGIHTSATTAPPTFNGLYIYNNYFGPNEGTCLFSQVYFSPNTGSAGSAAFVNSSYVFNNVINNNQANDVGITITGNGNAVYNNTFIGTTNGSGTSIGLEWDDISQNSGYTFTDKNNAFQAWQIIFNDNGQDGTNEIQDYNVYTNCTSVGGCMSAFYSGGTSNWEQYSTNSYRADQNSKAQLLGNTCCSGTLLLNGSFVPQSGSPVIGSGTNLYMAFGCQSPVVPGIGAACSDYFGNARPATGSWTAGAVNYGNPNLPAPPTGLVATVQ